MDVFEVCKRINNLINESRDLEARNELIKLLDFHKTSDIEYSPIVNHLIRQAGLYPYLDQETALWQDQLVGEMFSVDTGDVENKTLHLEQANLLKKLLEGKSIAVSAPTSFGKSFVIDAYISLTKPNNVVIIVPTIALTDETRRRLFKKFGGEYKIITTPDVQLLERNILIFPQERAINYFDKIENIDLLVVDEFYKAGIAFDKERAPILLKAILELSNRSKQKYFLAPNISSLNENAFTKGMDFVKLNFNTVFTEKHEMFKENEDADDEIKERQLLKVLGAKRTKTLIYAGTYPNIDLISNIINKNYDDIGNPLLDNFSDWLRFNYQPEYVLTELVRKGTGIHNGRLHRSLSQIQVKLFEEQEGLLNIVSTSSIIEGVNTSTENVIIWANTNGGPKLNDFTYKNIIGRSGRMFKHFIGKVYLLEAPPDDSQTQLNLEFTDDLLLSLDSDKIQDGLTREQLIKIVAFSDEMDSIIGKQGVYQQLLQSNSFQSFNSSRLRKIALDMKQQPQTWKALAALNFDNPVYWDSALYKVFNMVGPVGAAYKDMVSFIKVISQNWRRPIPDMLANLRSSGVTLEKFFELERKASFSITSVLNDINELQKHILEDAVDISKFISKLSNVFLPVNVYLLEEYGMPRMLSKKIHNEGLINLEDDTKTIHEIIAAFQSLGNQRLQSSITNLHKFEPYILDYFFEGISVIKRSDA